MAFKKIKTLDSGYTPEYWRIIQLNVNYDRPDSVAVLALYKSATDRQAGKHPLEAYQLDIVSEFLPAQGDTDTVKNITLQKAYQAIKKLAQAESARPEGKRRDDLAWFADAQDV